MDKKHFLPSDFEIKYKANFRKKRPVSSLDTAQRVVIRSELNETSNSYTETELEMLFGKKSSKFFNYRPSDSVGNVISYRYAPDYREQVKIFHKNKFFNSIRKSRKNLILQFPAEPIHQTFIPTLQKINYKKPLRI